MPVDRTAAWWHVALAGVVIAGAVCATARAAFAFEVVPRVAPPHRSHAAAWTCAAAGAGLVAASFPLADEADRRYAAYQHESDPTRIDARWNATVRTDRLASGALLGGEGLLVTAVWLRFVHRPPAHALTVGLSRSRCLVACSF